MLIQCQDGYYHRNPIWSNDDFVIMIEDDQPYLYYPREVQVQQVQRMCRKNGFSVANVEHVGRKNMIFKENWTLMQVYKIRPHKKFPKPDVSDSFQTNPDVEDDEPVIQWTS